MAEQNNTIKRPSQAEFRRHQRQEKHKKENPLRDVILGGQDGLVNALGIILGVMAASADVRILIATVIAATFAESLSMGAVAYTSALSQKDYYESERKKEIEEVEKFPEMEKEEVRRIYEKKGFSGSILEEIVKTITRDKKLWVETMMEDELKISPVNTRAVLKSSVIVTIATGIGHLIPLTPFFFISGGKGLLISVIVSGVTLFAVGVYQAVSLVGNWWKSGLRMVLIGLSAAFIGYFIARLFHASA
jgi:vacuolar iron transporter family protein